ncbi:tRNA-specific 2-thiouridylase MnmA [Litorimonas cladophorae]|uniref:tRNA-specific 2-thiouridylase MnmA n=1 Tax=Litorimonas cladophorae TaxID=1220491 RepID=A0A918KRC7_9PROT|nr:tRNA 2-thiouridine(34) synthase MnmA [Litorimonas cladophorae]GGX71630.1 tRNA-specific 2-thiouridylase MnmA [Litorimonas cladophorae]
MDKTLESSKNSLGFGKSEAETRVVVAMSGGVDSSVCAALLAREGYDVIGVTLQLYDHGEAIKKAKACCAGQDIYDAKRVAEDMGFPHYVLDYESNFKEQVIEDFADTYLKGSTPIPCVRCNQTVKFKDLLQVARDLGADCMATGHYIKRIEGKNGPELHRAYDGGKDQSYFLFATTRDQLDFLRFPLGHMDKSETRRLAVELGLNVAAKPDSQDICFVPTGKYTDVIEKIRPHAAQPGKIVHQDGTVLGEHRGVMYYTIGQRRGLGLGDDTGTDPLFVTGIDADKGHVVVGPRSALDRDTLWLDDINWLGEGKFGAHLDGTNIRVKVRSTRPPAPARLELRGNKMVVVLNEPDIGLSPGQACVFYEDRNDAARTLGGGWITQTA